MSFAALGIFCTCLLCVMVRIKGNEEQIQRSRASHKQKITRATLSISQKRGGGSSSCVLVLYYASRFLSSLSFSIRLFFLLSIQLDSPSPLLLLFLLLESLPNHPSLAPRHSRHTFLLRFIPIPQLHYSSFSNIPIYNHTATTRQ